MQMKQFRDPGTGAAVYATEAGAERLRDLGYTEIDAAAGARVQELEAAGENGEAIHGDLLVADYEAATAETNAIMVGIADLPMAAAVLAYEKAHKDRVTVTRAAEARVQELEAAGENE